MALGQFEFALLTSVAAAFIIFTPQPLVLLRNLLLWAGFTWLAWHGHECWNTSPLLRRLVDGLCAGDGVSAALEVTHQYLLEALDSWKSEAGPELRRNRAWLRIWGASLIVRALQWLQDDGTTSDGVSNPNRSHARPSKYQILLVTNRYLGTLPLQKASRP
ncbi:hypothetical protein BGZ63DRAFT_30102 [Mariannaea sp. PMI_226]|nr:hypothetical protein BGZ63DRAFT_30102 [Mariannaea sp. PMI_226]